MELFYHSIIESAATYGVVIWGGNMSKKDRKKVERVRKKACKIIGKSLPSWEIVYNNNLRRLGKKITDDNDHALNPYFKKLPSGRHLQQVHARTNRFGKSFVAQAIRILNK
jgi:hypothetical protein